MIKSISRVVIVLSLALAMSPAWSKPNHLVVGYSALWFDGIYPPESYNYDAFTHILRAFLIPKPDGTIVAQSGYWDVDLERMAHAHGVKLLASLGGAAPTADNWLSMARDPAAEKVFFDTLEKMITEHHYDGVDVDWEPSALTDADQATYTAFMKDLRARFPHWIISTALGASDFYGKHISWAEVANQVDWINWMAYDFGGKWSGHSVHDANLYAPLDPKVDSGGSIDQNLSHFETQYHLPPEKVVLGLPFYGVRFYSAHMGDAFSGDPYLEGSEVQYYEIEPFLADNKEYKTFWDEGAKASYLEKLGGGFVVSYDDPKSIAIKCAYAAQKGLPGVMIWNIGADMVGNRTPLLDAVAQAYGAPTMAMPPDGLVKSIQNLGFMLKDSYGKLQKVRVELATAGKTQDAQVFDPGTPPDFTLPSAVDSRTLGKKFWELQYFLSGVDRKLQDGQAVLDSLPVKVVAGEKIAAAGKRVLVDDFEKGGTTNALGGSWSADCDQNNLGTVLNPLPFTPAAGGVTGSGLYCARIFGHLGKNAAPWPYAELVGTLNPMGGAADLSDFKTLEFWTKGNGKFYSVLLARAAVQDYGNYRLDFKGTPEWTKVTLNFSDFKQPTWARQIPFNLSDVMFLAFTPNADFSDEDFDLSLDDITLVQ
jgi:chitinase